MKCPSRIAIDASAARMGGGASRTLELAVTLGELAPQHEYLFVLSPRLAERLTIVPPRSRLVVVPPAFASVAGRLAWQHLLLPSTMARAQADWILSPFNTLPLGPGLRRRTRRAVIVSNIGPFAPEIVGVMRGYQAARNRVLRTITLQSLSAADHVFLLSRTAQELLGSVLQDKPVTYLPMAPPSPRIMNEAEAVELPDALISAPFFVCAGDFFPYKGFEDAVRAVGLLRRSGRAPRLIVCGNPMDASYARSLQDLARREAPGGVVLLKGITQPQALALMRHSVATVMSSRAENTSRVPVEAMALGSPLLSADIPNARASAGDAALYYPPGDHERLAGLMRTVLESPDVSPEMSARGAARLSDLDWMSATRTLLEALDLL